MFFYGYDGLRAELNASAAIFCAFLDRLFAATKRYLNQNLPPSAQRDNNFKYSELVIVAHSLGAVIARRALLNATLNKSKWFPKKKIVLYAPAHKGANVVSLAMEALSIFPFLRFFSLALRYKSPLIDQLKPNSETLTNLLRDAKVARKGGRNPHLVPIKVIIAEYEEIVINDQFCDDPAPVAIAGTSHTTVCKPRRSFLLPLTHLENCL